MTESRAFELLGDLIDGWCARRALQPLALLLPAYLAYAPLTDATVDLYRALEDLRGLGPEVLTDSERRAVSEARALVRQALKRSGSAPRE